MQFKFCMSGKQLDPKDFGPDSPWHRVREKLLGGKFFYMGTVAKPNLMDRPQVVAIKQRCRMGEITDMECESVSGKSGTSGKGGKGGKSGKRVARRAQSRTQ